MFVCQGEGRWFVLKYSTVPRSDTNEVFEYAVTVTSQLHAQVRAGGEQRESRFGKQREPKTCDARVLPVKREGGFY